MDSIQSMVCSMIGLPRMGYPNSLQFGWYRTNSRPANAMTAGESIVHEKEQHMGY